MKKLLLLSVLSLITAGPLFGAEANPAAGAGANHENQNSKGVLIQFNRPIHIPARLVLTIKNDLLRRQTIEHHNNPTTFLNGDVLEGAHIELANKMTNQISNNVSLAGMLEHQWIEFNHNPHNNSLECVIRPTEQETTNLTHAISNAIPTHLNPGLIVIIQAYVQEKPESKNTVDIAKQEIFGPFNSRRKWCIY